VKIHFSQLQSRRLSLSDIHGAFPAAKFIVLYRRSIAEQYVSQQRAFLSGQWLLRSQQKRVDKTIRVDPSEFMVYSDRNKGFYTGLISQEWVKQHCVVTSYEELSADANVLFREKICSFLGVSPVTLTTDLVKQSNKSLRDSVENYDEVEALIGGASRHEYNL